MSAAKTGVKAALSLLPFRNGAEYTAPRDLEQLLAGMKAHAGYADAMGAGLSVLKGAACADGLRSRLIRMESPMMQAVVKDEARRALGALDQFGQAGFFKEWPSAQRELQ